MELADDTNQKNDLLVGADHYHKFYIEEIIRGKEGSLFHKIVFLQGFQGGHFNIWFQNSFIFICNFDSDQQIPSFELKL